MKSVTLVKLSCKMYDLIVLPSFSGDQNRKQWYIILIKSITQEARELYNTVKENQCA